MFQHTAARRRLVGYPEKQREGARVSTHSRPKAAGEAFNVRLFLETVSTHSRPKAAGPIYSKARLIVVAVSTHSRPKAAGPCLMAVADCMGGFNTQPPEGGWTIYKF